MAFEIKWLDRGVEPRRPPDPAYPLGKDFVAVDNPDAPTCKTPLDYPAPRCGYYAVKCLDCGLTLVLTTAGRPDDPRSLEINCRLVHEGVDRPQ